MKRSRAWLARGALFVAAAAAGSFAPLASSNSGYAPSLWVAATHGLVRLSADDGTVLGEIDRRGPPPDALAESRIDGQVWAVFHRELDAWSFDGSLQVSTQLPRDVHLNGPHTALAVDTAGRVLWLAGHKALYRFDLSGALQGTVHLDRNPDAVGLDPVGSRLWAARGVDITAYTADGNVDSSFSVGEGGSVRALAWSQALGGLWILRDDELERFDPAGESQLDLQLSPGLDRLLASGGDGTVWLAGHEHLARVDGSGLVEFEVDPFQGRGDRIVALVADPADRSVWVASRHGLAQVSADGVVLRTVALRDITRPHRREEHPGAGSVRALALYADVRAPALTFTAPASGAFVGSETPPLRLHYSDAGSGVDLSSVSMAANGAAVDVNCTESDGSTPAAGTADCALSAGLGEGGQNLSATVRDFAANESDAATLAFTVDTVPPVITLSNPSGRYTNQPELSVAGSVSEAGALTIDGAAVTIGPDLGFATTVALEEGDNTLTLVATDLAGNTATLAQTVTLDTVAPGAPNLGLIGVGEPVDGTLTVTGQAGSVEPGVAVTVTDVTTGASVTVYADQDGGFTAALPGAHGDLIAITLTDEAGNTTQGDHDLAAGTLPPAPASVAPALVPTGITPFAEATAFLYSGANPIQGDVTPDAIEPGRAAVIRGRVLDPSGNPLPGATVSVLHHPEFGDTQSRIDGRFDLAVNGGGPLTVVFRRKGYTKLERTVNVPWNDYVWAPDVVLRHLAADAGAVTFGASAPDQYVAGPTTNDESGSRQPAVFFPAGTTATLEFSDGSSAPLAAGSLRITEYTVGQSGPQAMPAKLPIYSSYTYAADFRFDEAAVQGASAVAFSQTVPVYLTNFLQAPVGTVVPSGFYDFDRAEWRASENGLVIRIVSVDDGGKAEVDVDGSGQPADAQTLSELGFTAGELSALAVHYPVGTELWRVPVEHFSPYDWNFWGIGQIAGLLSDVGPHKPQLPSCRPGDTCCEVPGCIVRAVEGGLGEKLPIVGTPYSLYYSNRRTVGGTAGSRSLVVPLTGNYDPNDFPNLQGLRLEVDVAGKRFVKDFPPGPNQAYTYVWDGRDGYGRLVTGSAKATVTVSALSDIRYVAIHYPGTAWNAPVWDGTQVFATRTDQTETVSKRYPSLALESDPPHSSVADGWDFGVHASYDATTGTLHQGDGTHRSIAELPLQPSRITDNLVPGAPLLPYFNSVTTLTAAGLVSVGLDGSQTKIADIPDGAEIVQLAVIGPSVYALDAANGQIDVLQGDSLTPVVTGLVQPRDFTADPGGGFLVAACGAVLSAQPFEAPVRVAGEGCDAAGDTGDGLPARTGKIDPEAIGTGSDGSVYFIQRDEVGGAPSDRVRTISRGGILGTVAGGGDTDAASIQAPVPATSVAFGALTTLLVRSDGTLLMADTGHFYTEAAGTVQPPKALGEGMVATHTSLLPSGDLLVSTSEGRLWKLAPALPMNAASSYVVAAPDGRSASVFDAYGRESGVYDTITGAEILSFQYDGEGRLNGLTDANGRTTTIQRGGNGNAIAIVSPDGQTTSLDVNGQGNLVAYSNPAGDEWQMNYAAGSLLTGFADPDGHADHYAYDEIGQLTEVDEPGGGGWTIDSTGLALAPSDSFAVTLTSGEGRVTSYTGTSGRWYCVYPGQQWSCGSVSMAVQHPDGTETLSAHALGAGWAPPTGFVSNPDGSKVLSEENPSLRFGYQSPQRSYSVEIPSGSSTGFSRSRSAVLKPGNPLAVDSYTEKAYEGPSAPYVNAFDAASAKWTVTDPMGRTIVTAVDSLDRPVAVMAPELATVAYAYDTAGRISGVTAGSGDDARHVDFEYYASGSEKGFLKRVIDPLGRTTAYAYDAAGRVISETLRDGEVIGFGYDAVGNLTSVAPPSRPAYDLGYDAVNDLSTYAPPAASGGSGAVEYTYNLDRQLTGIQLPGGNSVALHYDGAGRLTSLEGSSVQYQYDYDSATGQLSGIDGGDSGETLSFGYDGFLPIAAAWTGPVSGNVGVAYDPLFRVDSITVDGKGITYAYEGTLNAGGLLTQAGTLSVSHDSDSGLVTRAVLAATAGAPQGVSSEYSYDRFGELETQRMISAPEQLDLTLDVNPSIATDPTLNVVGTLPNGGELDICVNGATPCAVFAVLPDGSVSGDVELQAGSNSLAVGVYDTAGSLVGQGTVSVSYSPAVSSYTVDGLEAVGPGGDVYFAGASTEEPGDQLVLPAGAASATAPAGLQAANEGGLATAPDGSVFYLDANEVLWHWQPGGTLVSVVDLPGAGYAPPTSLAVGPDGDVYFSEFGSESIYQVDSAGAVSAAGTLDDCSNQVTAPDAPAGSVGVAPHIIAFNYDLTVAASADGIFVGCENVDQSAYVVHRRNADGTFAVQATSALSQPQFAAGPDGTICFAENGDTAIACIAPGGNETDRGLVGGVYGFGLDGSGTLYYAADDADGNSMLWRWAADGSVALLPPPSAEPSTLSVTGSVVTPQGSTYEARYSYNAAGEITGKTETINGAGASRSYAYDSDGRLTSVIEGGSFTSYGYDANGNRVSIDGETIATYNAQDQLLTYGSNGYTWNADGELATKTTSAGTTHYTWNALGELTDVGLPDGPAIRYLYDGAGRRVGKERDGTLLAGYLYAGGRIVAETDAGGELTERFVYATKANVPDYLIRYNGDGTSDTYRIVSDQVGTVRLVVDAATGEIVERIDYDVWGNIAADSSPGFQPFAFAGGLYDAETGLVHFGARDYDPETGRWISRDPILFAGKSSNLFEYVIDDPTNRVDVSGTQEIVIGGEDIIAPDEFDFPPVPRPSESPEDWQARFDQWKQGKMNNLRPTVDQSPHPEFISPAEPWWFIVFRLFGYADKFPWGSLGIAPWFAPCQNSARPQSKTSPPTPPVCVIVAGHIHCGTSV